MGAVQIPKGSHVPKSTPSERQLVARIAAHQSWANTSDRAARTSAARDAFDQRFLDQAAGDPVRAEHLRKAHYARLALRSAQARRKIKFLTAEAEAAEVELRDFGGGHDG
jgi:hypothetical protein